MRELIQSDRTTAVRVSVGLGFVLMVWGVFAPLIHYRSGRGNVLGAQSLVWSHSPIEKGAALFLLCIGIGSVVTLVLKRYEYLNKLAYIAFLTTVALFLLNVLGIVIEGRFAFSLFIPAWFSWWPHLAFAYAWPLLVAASSSIAYAAYLAGTAPELAALQGRVENAVATKVAQHQASKTEPRWVEHSYQPPSRVQELFWKGVASFLIFTFCFLLAPLGFFLWRFLDEDRSPHTGVALTGTILGAIIFGGGFLFQLIRAMASVGAA
jgi:hypothetical protein